MTTRRLVTGWGVSAAIVLLAATVSAQGQNPRFGKWKLKSEAPAPSSNVMTYEPFGAKGMKVTVESVNAKGEKTAWSYTTEFDGQDMPVTGQDNAVTSVRTIDNRINEIINKRNGRVTQVLTNVLSPDGDTIGVIYMRADEQGKTAGVTFATYERMKP
ncbi:MAG: hypothetical protein H0T71_01475 [Acidobacteria bacterium]|nr:hypothetical protein [Acidobacteriota bacterium]